MTSDPLTQQQETDALHRLVRAALLGVTTFFGWQPMDSHLPAHVRERMCVEVAIAYLLGQGLIVPGDEQAWREASSLTIPPHLVPNVHEVVLQEQARVRAVVDKIMRDKEGHSRE